MTEEKTDSDGTENKLSSRTTPTWEMELLISGATVFGLMQLPAPLSRATALLMNSNADLIASLISTISIYLYVSLIALIVAFILHLIARGYWVAMVGLDSVYPQGIKWDRISSFGPAHRTVTEESSRPIKQLIEQADNRATLIFGLGFGLAVALIIPMLIVGSMLLVLLIVQYLGGDLALWHAMIWVLLFILMGPWMAAYIGDYCWGEKLARAGKDGWLKSIFRAYQKIGFWSGNNTVVSLYTTNLHSKKMAMLLLGGGVLFSFAAIMALDSRGLSLDNGAFLGLPRTLAADTPIIRPENYRRLRTDAQSLHLVPTIEDVVVDEHYLRLFIPYQPSKYNSLIRKQCPAALAVASANKGNGMACLSKVFDIKMDGKLVAVPLMASVDIDTRQRGMVAMIDVRKLDAGQHELSMIVFPRNLESRAESRVHRIPFWK